MSEVLKIGNILIDTKEISNVNRDYWAKSEESATHKATHNAQVLINIQNGDKVWIDKRDSHELFDWLDKNSLVKQIESTLPALRLKDK